MSSVNLLPDELINKKSQRAKGMRWAALGVFVVLLVAGYSLLIRRNLTGVKDQLVPLEQQLAEKDNLVARINLLQQELERVVEKQNTVQALLDEPDWTHVFSELAEASSDTAWFESLMFVKAKVRQNETETTEVQFRVHGYAPSNFELANFIARLRKSSFFEHVEFEYSQMHEKSRYESVIEFEIKGTLS